MALRKITFIITLFTALGLSCTSTQVNQTLGGLSDVLNNEGSLTKEQVIAGLKEALIKGITAGSADASKLNGYFKNPEIKIPFPPEVQQVEQKLRQIGLGNEVDKFVMTLNRGAENAAKEAKPIFIDAIRAMTIQDAWGILRGADDAATQYLIRTTSDRLTEKFKPVIKTSLDKVNATRYYGDLITTYNKIPFVEDVNPDLDDYATEKAIEGLFLLIAKEEEKIRENPLARTTDLLKKVFSAQD